jgi:hypothetical protein
LDIVAGAPDRRQPRAERKRDDACSVGSSESSDHDVKRVGLGLERREGRCDILRPPDFEWRDFEAERACRGLNLAHLQHGLGIASIKHDCQPAQPGNNLAQEFDSLAGKIGPLDRESCDIAARPRQTCDQATADRIWCQWKDDGDYRCRLLYLGDGDSVRDDEVELQADELGRELGVALGASLIPAILDRDGATLDPAEFTQSLHKSSRPWAPQRRVCPQEPDGR